MQTKTTTTVTPTTKVPVMVKQLKFASSDVLGTSAEQFFRSKHLTHALALGNSQHHTVTLVLGSMQGVVKLTGVVKSLTDTKVTMEDGNSMPVRAVFHVIFR